MANILPGSKKKKNQNMYMKLLYKINESRYTVNGIKSLDNTKQTFKIQKNDVFYVEMKDIIAILKTKKIMN